jgi:hypothetical protein
VETVLFIIILTDDFSTLVKILFCCDLDELSIILGHIGQSFVMRFSLSQNN